MPLIRINVIQMYEILVCRLQSIASISSMTWSALWAFVIMVVTAEPMLIPFWANAPDAYPQGAEQDGYFYDQL